MLHLTPDIAAAAYDYIRISTPLFRKLPPSDEVEFCIMRTRHWMADHTRYCFTNDHVIRLSEARIGCTNTLMETIGHEELHAYQDVMRLCTPGTEHNRNFRELAKQVCRVHGWDYKNF